MIETWTADLRYAFRRLSQAPGFTIVALITLALGIGANSAIFSVVYGVLFRPMEFREPDQLVQIYSEMRGNRFPALSGPNFLDVQREVRSFESVGAFRYDATTLTGEGDPTVLDGAVVTAGFFEVLGVAPALGRSFRADENEPGSTRVVVLSDALWRDRFGADREILGRTILLDRQPYQVVGVMPRGFGYPNERALWKPLEYDGFIRDPANRGAFSLNTLARRAPGATVERADAELRALGSRISQEIPQLEGVYTMSLVPLRESIIGEVRGPLIVLLAAVGFVLLIACANVANLLLARASMRETEMAVRTALGAGRGRLTRQLLTESVLLGVLGGGLGLLLALWGSAALVRLQPADVPRLTEVRVDGAVVAFTFLLATLSSLIFGIAPALQATQGDPFDALREGGRGPIASRRGNRVRSGLVIAEMALAVLLLAGAGLLIRSFASLMDEDPGFRSENVVTFGVQLPDEGYPDDQRRALFYGSLLERVRALPGVQDAAAVNLLPLTPGIFRIGFEVEGLVLEQVGQERALDIRIVTPRFFETLGVPIRRGRAFDDRDRAGGQPVAILNEAAVRRFFPNDDPMGRTVILSWGRDGHEDTRGTVVGIAGDVKLRSVAEPTPPTIYLFHGQVAAGAMNVVVRTAGGVESVAPAARDILAALDANLPLQNPRALEDVVAQSVSQPRFYMLLLTLFAAVALALAAVGIFGVMSFAVAQRRREIGIRMALGAHQASVLRMVLARSLVLVGAGLAIGLAAAAVSTRLLGTLLYGVAPLDPLVLAITTVVLAGTGLLAAMVPARRASRLDPIVALRID